MILRRIIQLLLMLMVNGSSAILQCSLQSAGAVVDCQCSKGSRYLQHNFTWSRIDNLHIDSVHFSKCSYLILRLTEPYPKPTPSLVVTNVNTIVISQDREAPHLNMVLANVTSVHYSPVTRTGVSPHHSNSGPSNVMLVLGAVTATLVSTLIIVLAIGLVLYKRLGISKPNKEEDVKKVSRAESWRYEGSVYIKPSDRKHVLSSSSHVSNVPSGNGFVHPPPVPDFVRREDEEESHPRVRSNSVSTPLIRKNKILEVDVIRSSLQPRGTRQRHITYHGVSPPNQCVSGPPPGTSPPLPPTNQRVSAPPPGVSPPLPPPNHRGTPPLLLNSHRNTPPPNAHRNTPPIVSSHRATPPLPLTFVNSPPSSSHRQTPPIGSSSQRLTPPIGSSSHRGTPPIGISSHRSTPPLVISSHRSTPTTGGSSHRSTTPIGSPSQRSTPPIGSFPNLFSGTSNDALQNRTTPTSVAFRQTSHTHSPPAYRQPVDFIYVDSSDVDSKYADVI